MEKSGNEKEQINMPLNPNQRLHEHVEQLRDSAFFYLYVTMVVGGVAFYSPMIAYKFLGKTKIFSGDLQYKFETMLYALFISLGIAASLMALLLEFFLPMLIPKKDDYLYRMLFRCACGCTSFAMVNVVLSFIMYFF